MGAGCSVAVLIKRLVKALFIRTMVRSVEETHLYITKENDCNNFHNTMCVLQGDHGLSQAASLHSNRPYSPVLKRVGRGWKDLRMSELKGDTD